MKCKVCGNEVPAGEIYCSCGNPVTYNSDATPTQNFEGVTNTTTNFQRRMNNSKSPATAVIAIIIVVLAALGYFFTTSLCYSMTGTYKTVSEDDYSIKMPFTMSRNKSMETGDDVGCFETKKAAIRISKLTFAANPAFEEFTLEELLEMSANFTENIEFKNDGDLIYGCYTDYTTPTNKYSKAEKCYIIEGLVKADDAIYSVNAICLASEKSKMEDHML